MRFADKDDLPALERLEECAFFQLFGPKNSGLPRKKHPKNIKKHGEHNVLAIKMRVLNGLTGKNEFVSPRYFARVGHNPVKSAYSAKVLGPVLGKGATYELFQFVYDLWLWTTVGAKKNTVEARMCQWPGTALLLSTGRPGMQP